MYHADLNLFGVDNERLAGQRLARLQRAMKQHDLGALLLTDWINIRYATNTVMMLGLRATAIQRFAVIPTQGAPLICQRELSRKRSYRSSRFDAFMFGMRPPVATQDFVTQAAACLQEIGAAGERIGVDLLNLEAVEGLKAAGIRLVDGTRAVNESRSVKTADEIQLIRWTTTA